MLDITRLLKDNLIQRLRQGYCETFGDEGSGYECLIAEIADRTVSTIARSNSLYHNVEHTIQVTLVGQAILEGKSLSNSKVTPRDWLNAIVSLLCHDIGYVRDICHADRDGLIATGEGDERVALDPGSSDAALMPYHVRRAQVYVEESYSDRPGIDTELIKQNIERTRFPIPKTVEYQKTEDYPGLVRGADLIGQFSDPRYLRKLPAVFYEFEETGFNDTTGYRNPRDLLENYADFYQVNVAPYIQESLVHLARSKDGEQIIGSLHANLATARESSPQLRIS